MYVCMCGCMYVCVCMYVVCMYIQEDWPINKGALISGGGGGGGRLLAEVYCMNRIVSSGQAHQSVR